MAVNKRNREMDLAKGIGMLAVILAHIGIGKLGVLLYSFHLPLFFIISGYFFHYNRSFSLFIKKKMKEYLIPYLFCAIIISIFSFLFSDFNFKELLKLGILFIVQRRTTTLWFLAALFVSITIFWTIFTVFQCNLKKIMLTVTVLSTIFILYDELIGIPLPWNLDTAFIATFFLGVGYFLKESQILDNLISQSAPHRLAWVAGLSSVSLICTLGNYFGSHQTFEMFECRYGIFPLTLLAACTASVAVILFCTFIHKFTGFEWLGRNTMAFFALHQSVAIPIAQYIVTIQPIQGSILNKVVRVFLIFTIIMFICYLFHVVLIKAGLGFVLGKPKLEN